MDELGSRISGKKEDNMNITVFDLAQRYVGVREFRDGDHPLIQWWMSLCYGYGMNTTDETPWCSGFINGMAWELRLPRSKSARARSWLQIGRPVGMPVAGYDVVILKRGGGEQPGPEVINAPGHVGFYVGYENNTSYGDNMSRVLLLGGNQSDSVSIAPYDSSRILGIRRLYG